MDFIVENEESLQVGLKPADDTDTTVSDNNDKSSGIIIKKDEKTEHAFNQLEDTVAKTYEKTSEVLGQYLQEDEEGIHITLPDFNTDVTDKAQEYLKSLDSNLQNAEEVASNYWKKVSSNNFWSSMSNSLSSQLDKVVKIKDDVVRNTMKSDNNTSKNTSSLLHVAGNRTEAELRELSNNEKLYTDNKLELEESFNVDQKTDEISKLLETDKDIAKLMNKLVPTDVTYKDFWNIYFVNKQQIKEREDRRKKLLEAEKKYEEEHDDVGGWDDDEDDEEDNELEEKPVIIEKEDAVEPTIEISTPAIEEIDHKKAVETNSNVNEVLPNIDNGTSDKAERETKTQEKNIEATVKHQDEDEDENEDNDWE
ncbi:hypothetical protein TPHA_0C02780 [Tetrapisispora phaffii CBS 4417]|uniref:BSD domain-containing protein n=1 Tax=Tetrapisispora phaffii (strain ATCC 24235 / CBS 4417 / NBRC 1672 / NRRL Y-8282 / UCD 70-5) TaxID=1071381 RepID=G8BRQ5_TETPH|nr:hypothetical protein TPHA_0C02780 [Tetrapisispora phaffii CBS 4417]CCE62431.1 hypothetical protein TPHA_0C02780 [Tetrapisispora phaffii CBS 4417]